jgi:hypothetical protein
MRRVSCSNMARATRLRPPNLRRLARPARLALTATLLALSLTVAAWAAARLVAGGHYSGKTSQKQSTTIIVSSNAKTIAKLQTAIAYDHECATVTGATYSVTATNVPISNASFSINVTGHASKRSLPFTITGVFDGKTVAGTIYERNGRCPKPRQVDNPYLATYTAKTG